MDFEVFGNTGNCTTVPDKNFFEHIGRNTEGPFFCDAEQVLVDSCGDRAKDIEEAENRMLQFFKTANIFRYARSTVLMPVSIIALGKGKGAWGVLSYKFGFRNGCISNSIAKLRYVTVERINPDDFMALYSQPNPRDNEYDELWNVPQQLKSLESMRFYLDRKTMFAKNFLGMAGYFKIVLKCDEPKEQLVKDRLSYKTLLERCQKNKSIFGYYKEFYDGEQVLVDSSGDREADINEAERRILEFVKNAERLKDKTLHQYDNADYKITNVSCGYLHDGKLKYFYDFWAQSCYNNHDSWDEGQRLQIKRISPDEFYCPSSSIVRYSKDTLEWLKARGSLSTNDTRSDCRWVLINNAIDDYERMWSVPSIYESMEQERYYLRGDRLRVKNFLGIIGYFEIVLYYFNEEFYEDYYEL